MTDSHFANTVRRMLGVQLQFAEHGHTFFEYNGRRIMASSSFMGIEPKVIQECMKTAEYDAERAKLARIVGDRTPVVSVCYLERLKGLPLQLQAIESLLLNYKDLQKKVTFVIVALRGRVKCSTGSPRRAAATTRPRAWRCRRWCVA